MNDTSPEMEARIREMIRRKTPMERVLMGCSMFDLAKQLVKSSVLQKNPDVSPGRLRQELFLRFYENDFGPLHRRKILEHLNGL